MHTTKQNHVHKVFGDFEGRVDRVGIVANQIAAFAATYLLRAL